ncbi:MAG: NAD-dependent epimerase/dehydratase family protein, partial [Burkholderiales bacterium]
MLAVGVTGAYGFLGWHLRALLHAESDLRAVPAGRDTFDDPQRLRAFVSGVNAVVHLAGCNRGADQEISKTNIALAERLATACEAAGARPHVVFANSTHHTRSSAYGESKRIAAERLAEWSGKSGATFTNLVLPHVFGESCRPFYNSV